MDSYAYNSSQWATNAYNQIAREAQLRKISNGLDENSHQAAAPALTFARYSNSSLAFAIEYPSTWQVIENNNTIGFISPLDSPSDNYREGLEINVLPAQGSPLEQVANFIINGLKQNNQLYGTYLVDDNLMGNRAINFHCTLYKGNLPCEITLLVSVINNTVYVVLYHAYEFKKYLPIAEKMISSF